MVINATLVTSVKEFIEEDRRRTVREATEAIDTSYGTVRTILHDYLNMNRICARWVPKLLSTDEQNRRVDVSRQFLRRHAREGDEFLKRIITCDETWLWLFDPKTKQQSSQWRETSSPPPTKARVSKSGRQIHVCDVCRLRGDVTLPCSTAFGHCEFRLLLEGKQLKISLKVIYMKLLLIFKC